MKTEIWIGACAALALLLVTLVGCEREGDRIPPDGHRKIVGVFLDEDTLHEYRCASHATTRGYALVQYWDGSVISGAVVDLFFDPPQLGMMEWVDSALRDTTNDQGRVDFVFHAVGLPGDVAITAYAGTAAGSCSLHVIQEEKFPPGSSMTIQLGQLDSLWIAPGLPDSLWIVRVCLKDSAGVGIPDCSIPLHEESGQLSPFLLTDSIGCAPVWWYPPCCGWACVTFSVMQSDEMTACVFVDSL